MFRVHGIDVYLHFSWWFVFALLAHNLAVVVFPGQYPGLSAGAYWVMGVVAALLLFVSVLLHELMHSFVAKSRNVRVERITLFFFGGVASLPTDAIKPRTEFWMALSGPLFSLALGTVLYLLPLTGFPIMLRAILSYLAWINVLLALFNLVPAYPLDGGRVFRALLMFYYHDLRKATFVASRAGKLFGGILVFFGFLVVIFTQNFAGLWFIFIGGFLWVVAEASYQQVVLKAALGKLRARDALVTDYVRISPESSVADAVTLFRKTSQDVLVVEKNHAFFGLLGFSDAAHVPLEMRDTVRVSGVMIPARQAAFGAPRDNAYALLQKMEEQRITTLPIVQRGKVGGVVHRRVLMHWLALGMKR